MTDQETLLKMMKANFVVNHCDKNFPMVGNLIFNKDDNHLYEVKHAHNWCDSCSFNFDKNDGVLKCTNWDCDVDGGVVFIRVN